MTSLVSYPNAYPGKSSFLNFLQTKTLITNDEKDLIPRKEFGIAYREFCTENGLQQASVVDFLRHLLFLGIEGKPINNGNRLHYIFSGMAWKKMEDLQVVVKKDPEEELDITTTLRDSPAIYEGRESFILFCQSRLVFSDRRENQVILEELQILYKRFCLEQHMIEGSLADILNHLLSSGFDCLRVEFKGRLLYHSVFGVSFFYNVNGNGKVNIPLLTREQVLSLVERQHEVFSLSEERGDEAYDEEDFVRTLSPNELVVGKHLEDNSKSLKNKDEQYSEAGRQENIHFVDNNIARKCLHNQLNVPLETMCEIPCDNSETFPKRNENSEQYLDEGNLNWSQNDNRAFDIEICNKEPNAVHCTSAGAKNTSETRKKGKLKSREKSVKVRKVNKTLGSVNNFVERRSEKPKRWVKAVQLKDILKCSKNTVATEPLDGNEDFGDKLKYSENQTVYYGDACMESKDTFNCSKQQITPCSVVIEDLRHKVKFTENQIIHFDEIEMVIKKDQFSNYNMCSAGSESFNAVENREDDLIAIARNIGRTDRPKRWVSGVLLRDIRRHPIYQKQLHCYKDDNDDWVLFPPSFTYSGMNSFKKFFKKNINVTGKSHNLIICSDLYKAYQKFCFKHSLLRASANDIGHHLSVIGIQSVEEIIMPASSKLAYSGLIWKCGVLAEKYGNIQFKVMVHNCNV